MISTNTEPGLFDAPQRPRQVYGGRPPSRSSDTSRAAAARMRTRAPSLRMTALQFIRDRGDVGATSEEVGSHIATLKGLAVRGLGTDARPHVSSVGTRRAATLAPLFARLVSIKVRPPLPPEAESSPHPPQPTAAGRQNTRRGEWARWDRPGLVTQFGVAVDAAQLFQRLVGCQTVLFAARLSSGWVAAPPSMAI